MAHENTAHNVPMTDLWGPVIAGIGLLATVVFGIQNDQRSRYERVLALLEQLGTGDDVTSRHHLGRHVYQGFPVVTTDVRAALIEDFFIVVSGLRRIRATLVSVDSRFFRGPSRLLTSSSERIVSFMETHLAGLAADLSIVDTQDIESDLQAIRQMTHDL